MTRNAIFVALLFAGVVSTSLASPPCAAADKTVGVVTSPAKGSPERKKIIQALDVVVYGMSKMKVVFVVKHLKVSNGWAWIETDPQSVDGKEHYESLNGLLRRDQGQWRYVEGPPEWPICEEDPDCVDPVRYFKRLAAKHPGVSLAIFPEVKPDRS